MADDYPGEVYLLRTYAGRGRLILPNGAWVHTLEDRPIPCGQYFLSPDNSGRFRNWVVERARGSRCAAPAELDCFGQVAREARTDIEIHIGNTLDDTDGCILLGMDSTLSGLARSGDAIDVARRVLLRDASDPPVWGLTIMEVGT